MYQEAQIQIDAKARGKFIDTNLVIFGRGDLVSLIDPTSLDVIDLADRARDVFPKFNMRAPTPTPTPSPSTPTPNTNADPDSHAHAHTHPESNTHAYTEAETNAAAETDSNTNSNTGFAESTLTATH